MDLGYGNSNQVVGAAAAKAILAQTQAQENALTAEMAQYDTLLNSTDSELDQIRERRLAQMKKAAEQKSKWLANGHGTYTAIGEGQHGADAAREFFEVTKKSDRVVVHFHRPATRHCDVFHAHLEKLAAVHPETRFVKINVDQCSADGGGGGATYLVEKLGIVVMPTILIVKNRQAHHHIRGFDELGGTDNFSMEALEFVLGGHGALTLPEGTEPPAELVDGRAGVNDVSVSRFGKGSRRGRGAYGTSEDYEEED
mmetsp:Transcript_18770/g.40870  ORF Transcript_18770/g.40870 Transcript_18770/m.40870 type:complete len:255 (-) Transcript_18770:186-950(-)